MEAAAAADRKPGPPAALVLGSSQHKSTRGRTEGKSTAGAEGLLAHYVAATPQMALRPAAVAREALLALSFGSPRAEALPE